jgi:hypothetical protein
MFKSRPSFQCSIACFAVLAFFTVLHIFYVLIMLEGTSMTLMARSTWTSSPLSLDLDLSLTDDCNFTDAVVSCDSDAKKKSTWPPLSSLIEEKIATNNNGTTTTTAKNMTAMHNSSALRLTGKHLDFVDSLLDFAIIGFPKASTSFHIQWFSEHKEIQAFPGEV